MIEIRPFRNNVFDYSSYLRSILLSNVPPLNSPADLSNLVLWLDATDSSTLYSDALKTVNTAADGDVLVWEDKSGEGNDASQDATGKYPLRKIGVVNGADAVRFDGTDDFLTLGDTLAYLDNFTVFGACALKKGSSRIIAKRNGSNCYYDVLITSDSRFGINSRYGSWYEFYSNPYDLHAYVVCAISGEPLRLYVDGAALELSSLSPWKSIETGSINTLIGGINDGIGSKTEGDFVQVGMYDRALDEGEVASLSSYLMGVLS